MKLFFSKQHDVYEFSVGYDKHAVLALVVIYQLPMLESFRIICHPNPGWRIDKDDKEATNEQHHHLVLTIFKAISIKKPND